MPQGQRGCRRPLVLRSLPGRVLLGREVTVCLCVAPTEDQADLPALCHPAEVGVPEGAVWEAGMGPRPRCRKRHFHLHGKVSAPSRMRASEAGDEGGGRVPSGPSGDRLTPSTRTGRGLMQGPSWVASDPVPWVPVPGLLCAGPAPSGSLSIGARGPQGRMGTTPPRWGACLEAVLTATAEGPLGSAASRRPSADVGSAPQLCGLWSWVSSQPRL